MKTSVNFRKKVYFLAALLFICGMTFLFRTEVKAATPAPTGVKQTDASESSVEISWDAVFGDSMWYYWRVSDTNTFANCSSGEESSIKYSDCKYQLNGLQSGKTYYVQIGTSATSSDTAPEDTVWSAAISVVTVPTEVATDSIAFTGATEDSISLSWAAVDGATGYIVEYYRDSSEGASKVTTAAAGVTLTGLAKNTEYTARVYSYRQSETYTAASDWGRTIYNVPTLPTKVTGVNCDYFSPSVKKGYICLECDKNAVADGYQYAIYKYNGKKSLLTGTYNYSTISVTNSKLKPRQIYKVRMRAYVTTTDNQRRYGAWSAYDYISRCTGSDTQLKKSGNKIKASWKKVAGASGYTIYLSTKYDGKYKKMGTTKKTSYTINKTLKKNTFYYVRVVPYYKSGKKVYTATVNSNSQYSAWGHYYSSGRFYSWSYD